MLDGGLRVFAAEALFPVTALITAAFLARRLGRDGYGLLTLSVTLVSVVQWTISDLFASATVHHVSQARDWVPVGRAVLRAHFIIALVCGIAVALFAGPIATLLGQPSLEPYLRLLAIDIPLYGFVLPHRFVLTGLGRYSGQAAAMACRWLARLSFIVLFVQAGLSIYGAILGLIAATLVEIVVARRYVRVPLLGRSQFRIQAMSPTIAPLFVFSVLMRAFAYSDIIVLTILGATIGQVGVYAAAANLAIPISLIGGVVSPILLSGLSASVASGDRSGAQQMARQSLRIALLLLPFVGLVCGAAPELVLVLFGPEFADAAVLFVVLAAAAVLRILVHCASVILTAAKKPAWCIPIAMLILLAALLGHIVLIPRLGAEGAALSTLIASGCAAAFALAAIHRVWRVAPPMMSLLRCGLLGAAGYALPQLIPIQGAWVVLQLSLTAPILLLLLFASREFSQDEVVILRSLIRLSPDIERNS